MTEYYSCRDHFELPVPQQNFLLSMRSVLNSIEEVSNVVKTEGVSHLYKAETNEVKSMSAFEEATNRSYRMLIVAQEIHQKVLETIDSKLTVGLDETFATLNDVNGQNKQYTAETMSYEEEGRLVDNSTYPGVGSSNTKITVTKKYTLAQLLDGSTSPIQAAKDIFDKRLSFVRERIKNRDALSNEEIEMIEEKTDEELVKIYFPTTFDDYIKLKATNWQEQNKEALAYLELGLRGVATVAAIAGVVAASVGTGGMALPAVGALASTFLFADGAYGATTGTTMISGTQLTKEERLWALAETVAAVVSLGASRIFAPLARVIRSERLAAAAIAAGKADDAVDLARVSYDVMTKNEEEAGASIAGYLLSKGSRSAFRRRGHDSATHGASAVNRGETEFVDGHFTNPELETKYRQYLDKQHRTGEQALDPLDWKRKNDLMTSNRERGRQFEMEKLKAFKETADKVEEQITIAVTGPSGETVRTRVDAMGYDKETGSLVIHEYKSSPTAPLTVNQEKAFELIRGGAKAVVVGKGKGVFKGGFELPEGTEITVIRP